MRNKKVLFLTQAAAISYTHLYQNMGTVPRPTAPVTPRPAAQAGYTAPVQPNPAPTFSGIQKPRQPESSVQQMDIKIPDFLKNSRR